MALYIKILGILAAILGVLRVIFDFLNFIPATHCVYKQHTVENCPYNHFPPYLNVIGACMEAISSLALLLLLFFWERFYVKKYALALCRVGHFWVWFLLCICYVLSNFVVKSVESRDSNGMLSLLGVCDVVEVITLTFLAAAINFVAKETYQFWIEQKINSAKWRRFFDHLYCFVLFTYLFRNLGLFLYDTALVSLSISIVKGTRTSTGEWDSLLLVMNAAFRGSFVKFFFAKVFQGQDLPMVCDNIVENRGPPNPKREGQHGNYHIFNASSSPDASVQQS